MENKKLTTSLVTGLLLVTNLYSNEVTTQISTITITSATKSEQSIQDVTSNVQVITKEEIEERHFTTVTEALNTVNGISFTSNGGMGKASSVRLRGSDSKRILVLVDGIRYNDLTSSSGAPFEHIMIDDIERIEVIKGAQSGIWGSDASAGVINIITNRTKQGLNGNLNLEYGSFNTKKYGLNVSYGTENYYIKGFYNKVDTDGFTAYAAKGVDIDSYEDDGYKNETFGFKGGFNFDDNNKIDLSHTVSIFETEFDNFGSDSLTNKSTGNNRLSTINYENINSFAKTNLYFNRSKFHRDYPVYFAKYDGTVDEIGLKTNIEYLDNSSFLVTGVDYKKFKQDDAVVNNYKNVGVFLTNNNKFEKFVITESLRYDNYDAFDNKITGKLGVKYNFNEDLYFTANYGTAYNTPKLSELYGAFGANPDLNPETTKSYDLSIGYKDLELTYFHNKITDMISWNGAGYDNIDGESTLKGFELNYQKEVFPDTLLNIGYTKLSAKDNQGRYLARRADQTFKFGIDYYGFKDFHINVNGEYIGERYDSANKTGVQTGEYTVWNSVINYEINRKTNIYLKVDNIFDKYYQTVDTYATAPRSAFIGVKYSF